MSPVCERIWVWCTWQVDESQGIFPDCKFYMRRDSLCQLCFVCCPWFLIVPWEEIEGTLIAARKAVTHTPLSFYLQWTPLGSLGRFRHYSPWYLLFSMSVAPQSLARSVICLGRQEHKKDGTALTKGLAACRGRKHLRHEAPAHSWWAYHRRRVYEQPHAFSFNPGHVVLRHSCW